MTAWTPPHPRKNRRPIPHRTPSAPAVSSGGGSACRGAWVTLPAFPKDYVERVYAGVLGKIIGVYLGRPFEGWSYEHILRELGEIEYYVHERRSVPLVVTDDDISGTFTFVRALADHGYRRDPTPAEIGETWLNYIIENRSILWWGGLGNSTEHTAFLRLQNGIPAPRSGSIALNGKVVAEQIGAQIFIDGWAMVSPGDPERAADLARRAASVSHDGEAIHAAQVVAAMEAQAFTEPDLSKLLDTATRLIPPDSLIARLIADIRAWHAQESDWRKTRQRIADHYGYDRYGGNCHVLPNHALIILALLYGDNDFQKALKIVNTCGWDTDCNSGNVGCILGIKNGLDGIDAGPDWRGPVADRLYVAAADGGRVITDAVSEAYRLADTGRRLAGEREPIPKRGARFHFDLPGSVQGFRAEETPETSGTLTLSNADGHSTQGARSLALRYRALAMGRFARAATPTFVPPDALHMGGYGLHASPTLYPGQTLRAEVEAAAEDAAPVQARLFVQTYGADDRLVPAYGPDADLAPGQRHAFTWRIPDTGGAAIAEVGLELAGARGASGTVYLDYLTWDGTPEVTFDRPAQRGTMWRRAWTPGADQVGECGDVPGAVYRVVHNRGTGLAIQGTREWTDYQVCAAVTPHMAASAGIAARVQGLRRYYALVLVQGDRLRLVKRYEAETATLAEAPFPWTLDRRYDLALTVVGDRIQAQADGRAVFDVRDSALDAGAVALVVEEGRMESGPVRVTPAG